MTGKQFATIRKVSGLNQQQMADKLRVSRSLVAKLEIDSRKVQPYIVTRLYIEFGEDHVKEVSRIASEYVNGA